MNEKDTFRAVIINLRVLCDKFVDVNKENEFGMIDYKFIPLCDLFDNSGKKTPFDL